MKVWKQLMTLLLITWCTQSCLSSSSSVEEQSHHHQRKQKAILPYTILRMEVCYGCVWLILLLWQKEGASWVIVLDYVIYLSITSSSAIFVLCYYL